MQVKRIVLFCAAFALGLCPLFAATPDSNIVITWNGTLNFGDGTDCLSENGVTMTTTATFSSSATPSHISTGGTLVTYKLPPGAVTVTFSGGGIPNFTSTMSWTAVFSLKGQHLELSGGAPHDGDLLVFSSTKLEKGSWSRAILEHPTAFSPSPQNVSGGWGYHRAIHPCGANFGFVGTASN